jgi:hypothetical protein
MKAMFYRGGRFFKLRYKNIPATTYSIYTDTRKSETIQAAKKQ